MITAPFGGLGVASGLWLRDFGYLTVMNRFIRSPLVFFGAVFYSLEILSPLWRSVSLFDPMDNSVRYGVIGVTGVDP